MSDKPNKILYPNQSDVWDVAVKYLTDLVSNVPAVEEAIVWGSLADEKFGVYEKLHAGREASDIDLVVIINEKELEHNPLPKTWVYTTVSVSCFDLFHIGKFVHDGHVHEVDGLLVSPSRHSMDEIKEMLTDKSKAKRCVSIYSRSGKRILGSVVV